LIVDFRTLTDTGMCPCFDPEVTVMTLLRQRMLDELILRGLAPRTQESYIGAVSLLARNYRCSPDLLSAEQVRGYLLHLLRDLKRSRSTVNQYGCAFRFLYGTVLGLNGNEFFIPLGIAPQRLPEILSREELARLFAATTRPGPRTFLMLAYGTGMRLSELCGLRVADIDSHADRMCIRVVQGKGGQDRYVPLAPDVLELLRSWWRSTRPRQWFFPGQGDSRQADSQPICDSSPQKWYHAARTAAGITKQGGIHTLRHCYATHLLEAGVDLHSLSQWLGHRHISTTSRYLHLVRPDVPDGARRDPLKLLDALATAPAPAAAVPSSKAWTPLTPTPTRPKPAP
jgi:integrase